MASNLLQIVNGFKLKGKDNLLKHIWVIRSFVSFGLLLVVIIQKGYSQLSRVDSLKTESVGLFNRGLIDSAATLAYKAEGLLLSLPDSGGCRAQASLYGELIGPIEAMKNKRQSAHSRFLRAYSLISQCGDTTHAAFGKIVLEGGKNAYQLGGQYLPIAETWLKQAEIFYKAAHNGNAVAQAAIGLGNMAYMQGNFALALIRYEQAQTIVDTLPQTPNNLFLGTSVSNNMAAIYQVLGDYEKSAITGQKTLNYARRTVAINKPTLATLMLNQASFEELRGNIAGVKAILDEATDTIARLGVRTLTAELQKQWSSYYITIYDWNKGLKALQEYFHINDSLGQKPNSYAGSRKNLAFLYIKAGHYETADSIARDNLPLLCGSGSSSSYGCITNRVLIAEAMYGQKKYPEAADSLIGLIYDVVAIRRQNLAGLSEQDQLSYNKSLDLSMQILFACLEAEPALFTDRASAIASLQFARKAVVLSNWSRVLQRVRASSDSTTSTAYREWLAIRQQASGAKAGSEVADSLAERVVAAERRLSRLAGEPEPFSVTFQQLMDRQKSRVYIDFVRVAYSDTSTKAAYAAMVMGPNIQAPQWVPLCSEKQLLKLLQDKKGNWLSPIALAASLYSAGSAQAATLYSLLWKPLEKWLPPQTELTIGTTGILNNISLGSLWNGRQHLVERHAIRYQTSFAKPLDDTLSLPGSGYIWAYINYGKAGTAKMVTQQQKARLRPANQLLSGNNQPLLPINGVHPTQWLTPYPQRKGMQLVRGEAATEAAFVQAAPGTEGLLQIVTHGFYQPKAVNSGTNALQNSGLAMSGANASWMGNEALPPQSDGILTAHEISALNLGRVKMAVLTACETALGESTLLEGNMGLVRGFKIAGVQKVMASLWPVPAKATNELMLAFYRQWALQPNPAKALRQAQLALLAKGYPPFYWAGWVLVE